MNKKKLLILALVVIMIATISFSTLAWFSDADEVTNEFLVAGSDDKDPDDIFSVTVWENVPGETEGQKGHTYKNILPGDHLKKEVHVKNTGSYDQYIRVIVTISDAEAWVNAMGWQFNPTDLFEGYDASKWVHVWNNLRFPGQMPEDIVLVMYYKDVVKPGDEFKVIDAVNIPTSLTQQQAAVFAGGFSVDIKAQAVQTENVIPEGTAANDAAWMAFWRVGMGIDD